jgi:S1-C subfamily serine protease
VASAGSGDWGEPPAPAPQAIDTAPPPTEYGFLIQQLGQGTAYNEGLREGDIILSLDGVPTPTFDDLARAVQQAGRQAEVIFLNVENGRRESILLYPVAGRIGVTGQGVRVE